MLMVLSNLFGRPNFAPINIINVSADMCLKLGVPVSFVKLSKDDIFLLQLWDAKWFSVGNHDDGVDLMGSVWYG